MNCVKCGKEFTPLSCPTCGNTLDAGTCPACNEGQRIKCGTCGQELEIARVDAAVSEGISPDGARPGNIPPYGGQGETMSEAAADIASAADAATSAGPVTSTEPAAPAGSAPYGGAASPYGAPPAGDQPTPPQQSAAPPPPYTPPVQQAAPSAPPPQYGTPGQTPPAYGQPPAQGYTPPQGYGQQASGAVPPPPPGQPGYGQPPYGNAPYPHIPRQKVNLGGWLLCYFVLAVIGLVFSAFGLIGTLVSFDWISLIVSAVCSVLPLIMILYFISKRNWKFFIWYRVLAIINFVSAGILIVACFVGRGYLSQLMEEAMQTVMVQPEYYESAELFESALSSYNLTDLMVNYVIGFVVVYAVITIVWNLCWWIYFKRSKRVAYTFDPRNNPPA